MTWRVLQSESRERYLQKFSASEVAIYERWIEMHTSADHHAFLDDLQDYCSIEADMEVLDLGAGTGAVSTMLNHVPGIKLTALEPCPEMLSVLKREPHLAGVTCVQAFCDHPDDQIIFAESSFDIIASRQLFNGLYDPLAALRNCYHWLKPQGSLIVAEGFYDRDAWKGIWEEEIDQLPLSACRTMATIPYLAEQCGFQVIAVTSMKRTNSMPTTRTPRYLVVAQKSR
jgi:ubiquinone/menaquinone biosynthesis C-methylase UbiE